MTHLDKKATKNLLSLADFSPERKLTRCEINNWLETKEKSPLKKQIVNKRNIKQLSFTPSLDNKQNLKRRKIQLDNSPLRKKSYTRGTQDTSHAMKSNETQNGIDFIKNVNISEFDEKPNNGFRLIPIKCQSNWFDKYLKNAKIDFTAKSNSVKKRVTSKSKIQHRNSKQLKVKTPNLSHDYVGIIKAKRMKLNQLLLI